MTRRKRARASQDRAVWAIERMARADYRLLYRLEQAMR